VTWIDYPFQPPISAIAVGNRIPPHSEGRTEEFWPRNYVLASVVRAGVGLLGMPNVAGVHKDVAVTYGIVAAVVGFCFWNRAGCVNWDFHVSI